MWDVFTLETFYTQIYKVVCMLCICVCSHISKEFQGPWKKGILKSFLSLQVKIKLSQICLKYICLGRWSIIFIKISCGVFPLLIYWHTKEERL